MCCNHGKNETKNKTTNNNHRYFYNRVQNLQIFIVYSPGTTISLPTPHPPIFYIHFNIHHLIINIFRLFFGNNALYFDAPRPFYTRLLSLFSQYHHFYVAS